MGTDGEEKFREKLAAIEHQRWAEWQQYVHSLCEHREDGALIIPAGHVMRWEQQIDTSYAELTEHEKDMDRQQVDRYWHLIWPTCPTCSGQAVEMVCQTCGTDYVKEK